MLAFLAGRGATVLRERWGWKAIDWIDKNLAPALQSFAKWYFDLLKNAFVAVALLYAWKKTGSEVIGAVTSLTIGIFFFYLFSYPWTAHRAIQAYGRSRSPLLSLLAGLLSAVVLGGLVTAVGMAGDAGDRGSVQRPGSDQVSGPVSGASRSLARVHPDDYPIKRPPPPSYL
jgi:hypothetical protein